jgi:hypothetical protein
MGSVNTPPAADEPELLDLMRAVSRVRETYSVPLPEAIRRRQLARVEVEQCDENASHTTASDR